MCEPTHSIVQYPENDPDSGDPTDSKLEATPAAKLWDWFKRVGGFWHCSKLGSGHSEAVSATPSAQNLLLPKPLLYEGLWWCRKVRLDPFPIGGPTNEMALEAATEYSHRVVIGSLSMLRRFLETSMRKSERPQVYVRSFLEEMVKCEIEKNRLYRIIRKSGFYERPKDSLEIAIKLILGASRKRSILCPEWADDSALWAATPGQVGLQG